MTIKVYIGIADDNDIPLNKCLLLSDIATWLEKKDFKLKLLKSADSNCYFEYGIVNKNNCVEVDIKMDDNDVVEVVSHHVTNNLRMDWESFSKSKKEKYCSIYQLITDKNQKARMVVCYMVHSNFSKFVLSLCENVNITIFNLADKNIVDYFIKKII